MASAARAAPLLAISRPRVMLDWVTERVRRIPDFSSCGGSRVQGSESRQRREDFPAGRARGLFRPGTPVAEDHLVANSVRNGGSDGRFASIPHRRRSNHRCAAAR
jgi:hypothetical protein